MRTTTDLERRGRQLEPQNPLLGIVRAGLEAMAELPASYAWAQEHGPERYRELLAAAESSLSNRIARAISRLELTESRATMRAVARMLEEQ